MRHSHDGISQSACATAASFLFLALTPGASAQEALLTITGSSSEYFGSAVDGIGDVDGDGFADMVVGSYHANALRGRIEVVSGRTGQRIRQHPGATNGELFGEVVAGVGDVNGDGHLDYAAGGRQANVGGAGVASGVVRVYSGLNGALIHEWKGSSAGDQLGSSLSGAGDVNQDGFADVIAGGFTGSGSGLDSGLVQVFSGADGAVLYFFDGDAARDGLGASVSGVGDVNADGFADFAATAPGHDGEAVDTGLLRVYSGETGETLFEVHGERAGAKLGVAVSEAGDVDFDGFPDIIVSSFLGGSAGSTQELSSLQVLSGEDGAQLYERFGMVAGDWFGFKVDSVGDVNADGIPDIVAGSYRDSVSGLFSGSAYVLSGGDGSVLFGVHGATAQSYTGWSVAGAGDTNGDGRAEVLVGSLRNTAISGAPGSVVVYGFTTQSTGVACLGELNSSGLRATLTVSGSTVVADNNMSLVVEDLPHRSAVVFLNSRAFGMTYNPAIGNTVSRGNLCLAASPAGGIGRHRPVSAGMTTTVELMLDLSDIPAPGPGYSQAAIVGESWYWQGWYRDNAMADYSNFTDAVLVVFD